MKSIQYLNTVCPLKNNIYRETINQDSNPHGMKTISYVLSVTNIYIYIFGKF